MRDTPQSAGDADTRELNDLHTREMNARELAADAALAEYLERTERGEPVEREAFLGEHPDVATELREYFAATDEIDGLLDLTFPEDAAAELEGARGGRLGAPAMLNAPAVETALPEEVLPHSTQTRGAEGGVQPEPNEPRGWQLAAGAGVAVLVLAAAALLLWPAPPPPEPLAKGEPDPARPRRPFVTADVAWDGKAKVLAPRAARVNKLVGHWRFTGDEPATPLTVTDASGFGHSGKLAGGLTWGAGGLELDGADDAVALGNPPQLDFEGPITMAAWVKPLNSGGLQNILAHGHEFAPPSGVFLRISAGKYQAGSWNGGDHVSDVAIPPADLGNWVHLCGVYDGQAWRLYRQGELTATRPDPQGATLTPGDWAIGATGNLRERNFKGGVREVWIYDRALTAEEVRKLAVGGEVK